MNHQPSDPLLLSLREQIAAADRELLAAFSKRLRLAAKIKAHKVERGYRLVDHKRERQLLEEWRQANDGTISDAVLVELFETVLKLSKRELGS